MKNVLDSMGTKRLWYGFAKAAKNKDTYTIGYLYGEQLGEASLVWMGDHGVKGIGKKVVNKASKVLSKGKNLVGKKNFTEDKKGVE